MRAGAVIGRPRRRPRRRGAAGADQGRLDVEHQACAAPVAAREERPRTPAIVADPGAGGRRSTLGDAVASAWEDLLAAGSAPCPVCGDVMRRESGVGYCESCGSSLH